MLERFTLDGRQRRGAAGAVGLAPPAADRVGFGDDAAVVAALALASLAYSSFASWAAPAEGFYSPLSRAWQLLAGALPIGAEDGY